MYIFIQKDEWQEKKETREAKRMREKLSPMHLLLKWPPQSRLGWAEAKSQELPLCLPHGGSEVEQGLKPRRSDMRYGLFFRFVWTHMNFPMMALDSKSQVAGEVLC